MVLKRYDIDAYIETAHELAEKVKQSVEQIEAERQLPSALADEIAAKGFFRLLVPRALGGSELDHPDFLKLVEVFAKVDASAAWCFNQNNVFATNSCRMPAKIAQEIYGSQRSVITNGPPLPGSVAEVVEGGYRLKGRWVFSSGVRHGTWIAALVPIKYPGQDKVSTHRDDMRVMLMPKSDVKLVDNWQVKGFRGTGSFGFEIDDLYIPNERSYSPSDPPSVRGPLYVIPTTLLFAAGFATVALGVARASLDAAIQLSIRKVQGQETGLLQDKLTTHRQVGETEAIWRSASAYLRECASAVWHSACERGSLTDEERINLRLAATFTIRRSAEVVDSAYNLSGSSAIFASNPVQRRFQDIHVLTQQIQGRLTHYDTAGQFFLGLQPDGQF